MRAKEYPLCFEHDRIAELGLSARRAAQLGVGVCDRDPFRGSIVFIVTDWKTGKRVGYFSQPMNLRGSSLFLSPTHSPGTLLFSVVGRRGSSEVQLLGTPVDVIKYVTTHPTGGVSCLSGGLGPAQLSALAEFATARHLVVRV